MGAGGARGGRGESMIRRRASRSAHVRSSAKSTHRACGAGGHGDRILTSSSSHRRMLAMMSRGLWFGISVDHPVAMPAEPLTRTIGRMGT